MIMIMISDRILMGLQIAFRDRHKLELRDRFGGINRGENSFEG
jgi:hypothetical protein